jgi:Domain of unknown function (DUF4337)
MAAHESLHRFERIPHGELDNLARTAAILVAVLAALLAIATFLSNEAMKEVITGETKVADATAVMEANEVKRIVAESNAQILRVVAVGSPLAQDATAKALALDVRIEKELAPTDRQLADQINDEQRKRDRADDLHLVFELSAIGFEVGIVVAGISMIVRRRWLLAGGGVAGLAGVAFMIAGLII